MKTIMHGMMLAILMLVFGSVADAQVHSVLVYADTDTAAPVVNALKAKIGGTTRYALSDSAPVELLVVVECLARSHERGFICSFISTIVPASVTPFSAVGPHILCAGPDVASIAELMFQEFVKGTSDKSIEASVGFRRAEVSAFCKDLGNKKYCQP